MNVAATTTALTRPRKPAAIRDTAERRRTIRTAFAFLAPSLLGVILFLLIPIAMVIGLSLVQWNMLTPMKWVGLSNYVNIFEFDGFGHSLIVTAYYVILNIPIQTAFALGMAMLLRRKHDPLELAVDTRYLQFFDPGSGLSIGHPKAAPALA
jgi:ABC-type sugar transport system permease subunit